eukprot:ctg_433.g252
MHRMHACSKESSARKVHGSEEHSRLPPSQHHTVAPPRDFHHCCKHLFPSTQDCLSSNTVLPMLYVPYLASYDVPPEHLGSIAPSPPARCSLLSRLGSLRLVTATLNGAAFIGYIFLTALGGQQQRRANHQQTKVHPGEPEHRIGLLRALPRRLRADDDGPYHRPDGVEAGERQLRWHQRPVQNAEDAHRHQPHEREKRKREHNAVGRNAEIAERATLHVHNGAHAGAEHVLEVVHDERERGNGERYHHKVEEETKAATNVE